MRTETDCRSEEGITVGLIDAVISICRVLAPRLKLDSGSAAAVEEALKDLRSDSDVAAVTRIWAKAGVSPVPRISGTFKDVEGIDITGGVDPVKFIRSLRGE